MSDDTKETSSVKQKAPTYTKEQFLNSKQFSAVQKDIFHALLKDGESYTMDQVKKLVQEFLKKEVK